VRRRKRRRWPLLAALVVVLAAGGAIVWAVTRGATTSQAQPLATATVQRRTLTQTVDASFTLAKQDTSRLASPAAGTVTSVALTEGAALKGLIRLVGIDGTAIYGIPSSYPLYRNLAEGDEGPDVAALQWALKAAGHDPGATDGDFGSGTAAALEDWQASQGLDETGRLDLVGFVSYPPGSLVDSVAVKIGDRVGAAGQLATLAPKSSLAAEVDVSQLDIGKLKLGQAVLLTLDGLDGATAPGKVSDIAGTAEQATSSAGTSTVVQYQVTMQPSGLPSGARAGMTGQASVTTASRNNVLVVPSSAIGGSATAPTVQVVQDGSTVIRPVVVGLVTTTGTEILTGVRAGEQVVTGVTGSGQGTGAGQGQQGGGFPGGGFFRGGGR
jgi:peptidoglycan hydrolase-like protein with peptidoglycan-binding domain